MPVTTPQTDTTRPISATAPGKVIVFGDHVVVNGYKGVAIPTPEVATSSITRPDQSPQSGLAQGPAIYLASYDIENTDLDVAENWLPELEKMKKTDPDSYLAKFKSDKFNLIRTIIAAFRDQYLPSLDLTGHQIKISSEVPMGGFGSSTAVVVSLCKALAKSTEVELTADQLAELALAIETYTYLGHPSGIDQHVSAKNTALVIQRRDQGIDTHRIDIEDTSKIGLEIFSRDSAPVTTGETVAYVQARLQKETRVKDVFAELGEISERAIALMKQKKFTELKPLIRASHKLYVELGVVSEITQDQIAEIEARGGAAKISAGGTLNHLHPDKPSGLVIGML